MSRQFVKTDTGKSQVAKPKVRVFDSIASLETALANNEVEEGEIVTTEFLGGTGDVSLEVEQLEDLVAETSGRIGPLASLNTEDKSNAVAAINEVLDKVGNIQDLETEDKTNAVAAINELVSIMKQTAFDAAHPVGDVYVQFPQQSEPTTLYNVDGITSTWEELEYNGAFFRSSGGLAESFIEADQALTPQADQNKKHRHSYSYFHPWRNQGDDASSNCFSNDSWDSSYTSYEGGDEARPVNFTVKIWKRVS